MAGPFDARDFPPARVLAAKAARRISACVPARDEAATIAGVVSVLVELMDQGIIDEVVVMDDSSTDSTAAAARAAGACVHDSSSILAGYPCGPGKGEALWRGVHVTDGDVVVFCDADVIGFSARFVLGLVGPLLEDDDIGLVKAYYRRPLDGRADEGGRVTELMARPVVAALFPHLGFVLQPLAGEFAARREILEGVGFTGGYAVDLGLLVDISQRWGVGVIAQCDLGVRTHRNRPLSDLGPQALAILQLALDRSAADLRSAPRYTSAVLARPDAPDAEVTLQRLPALESLVEVRPA